MRAPAGRDDARAAVGANADGNAMGEELADESLGAGVLVLETREVRIGGEFFLVLLILDLSKADRIKRRADLGVL